MPSIDDYYEPWTYDYENLTNAPLGEQMPVAPPRSLITGEPMKVQWSANWDDNLGGSTEILSGDPILAKVSQQVKLELEQTFMFYLPRICEHCLNPSCVASCPSGAMYKRAEDGIVLVDQDKCRGWRMCVTGCPYKKVYFNHRTGKAEKCTFCYPRIEVGLPTVCAETCVGRLRYIGLILYDADRVLAAASAANETDLYEAQLDVMLDPTTPRSSPAPAPPGSPTSGWTPPVGHRCTRWRRTTGSRCRCTRNTAPCRWSGTCRRSRRWSTRSAGTATTGRTPATCSARSRPCAYRSSTSPGCSPPATPPWSRSRSHVDRRRAVSGVQRRDETGELVLGRGGEPSGEGGGTEDEPGAVPGVPSGDAAAGRSGPMGCALLSR